MIKREVCEWPDGCPNDIQGRRFLSRYEDHEGPQHMVYYLCRTHLRIATVRGVPVKLDPYGNRL